MTDDEFTAHTAEQEKAPACGSCILLAGHLRYKAAVIYRETSGRVAPTKGADAWSQLRGTRWERQIGLDEFLARDLADLRYERINYAIDPLQLDIGSADYQKATEQTRQYREAVKAAKAEQDATASDDDTDEPPT